MSVHIYDLDCPKCGIKCWVNNGDVSDLTVMDVERVRCWHCHSVFCVPGVDWLDDEELDDEDADDTYQTASQAAGDCR